MQYNAHLLDVTEYGFYCCIGDFYVDPWRPVSRAVITHAHADHAVAGCGAYLVSSDGEGVLKNRLGETVRVQPIAYGEAVDISGVTISLHPAGHILGSAQVRIEHRGEVWVISGDYKIEPDPTCAPFEPLRCHVFITESTFGLPVFCWQPQRLIFNDINQWWKTNQADGKTSVLFAYALGKAQRILAGIDASIGAIYTHGAVENVNSCYRKSGVALPPTLYVGEVEDKKRFAGSLVVAPPLADSPVWAKKFPAASKAFASGWMQIRGHRRRRALDRGFVLSDHAGWNGLLDTIFETGAQNIWVTHGYATEMVRWLREKGLNATAVSTRYSVEIENDQV